MENNDEIYKKMIAEIDAIKQRADARHQEFKRLLIELIEVTEAITEQKKCQN